jgi:hypothetical protein
MHITAETAMSQSLHGAVLSHAFVSTQHSFSAVQITDRTGARPARQGIQNTGACSGDWMARAFTGGVKALFL